MINIRKLAELKLIRLIITLQNYRAFSNMYLFTKESIFNRPDYWLLNGFAVRRFLEKPINAPQNSSQVPGESNFEICIGTREFILKKV